MNTKLIFAGGSAFGALVGWALTADHYDQRLKVRNEVERERSRQLTDQIIDQKKMIEALQATIAEPTPSEAEVPVEGEDEISPEETPEETVPEVPASIIGETVQETRANLQRQINHYSGQGDDAEAVESSEEFFNKVEVAERDITPPYVISYTDYAYDDEGMTHDKVTLKYFPRHRTLIEEEGEDVIEDVANTVGWKNLNRFGDESNDMDTVFIRNRRLEIDYEVVRDEENDLPLHVKYGMGREEFASGRAAGVIRLRPEDRG